jgi:hypothetical protein
MAPLIRAETWLGAAGWASGSQACSGTSPAFEPAPISVSTTTSTDANSDSRPARIATKR